MKQIIFILSISLLPIIMNSQANIEIDGKAKINQMDTVNSVKSNVVWLNDGSLAILQYEIGDFAHGGVVFWINETGDHGLVVDIMDISTNQRWYNFDGQNRITNALGKGIYSGIDNTTLIISRLASDNFLGQCAALTCANLVRGDFGDWYLPSITELNEVFLQKTKVDSTSLANGGTIIEEDAYWSSTEFDSSTAWYQIYPSGLQEIGLKITLNRIRAIRKF